MLNTPLNLKLYLKKDQERRLLAGHLWAYSNEIDTQRSPLKNFQPGEWVEFISHKNQSLGLGYINPNTLLCARLVTRKNHETIDRDFFQSRLEKARTLRDDLYNEPYYRLVYGESDFLPGLIIDRFNHNFVIQITTAGMEAKKELILDALTQCFPNSRFLLRNDNPFRELEGLSQESQLIEPTLDAVKHDNLVLVKENGAEFFTNLAEGQKTGWFYDHRESRALAAKYATGRDVLDLFSYLGAFAIPIAKAGAKSVIAVDASRSAIDGIHTNATHNGVSDRVTAICADVFEYLSEAQNNPETARFDLIILDPPALIKRKKDHPQGLRAYERLNQLALGLLKPGGYLFSASCSMHLSSEDLLNCLRRASLKAKRPIKILSRLGQGMDHPVHPAIPETEYLKGFWVVAGDA